jgi:hypothetical protein
MYDCPTRAILEHREGGPSGATSRHLVVRGFYRLVTVYVTSFCSWMNAACPKELGQAGYGILERKRYHFPEFSALWKTSIEQQSNQLPLFMRL